MKWVAFYIYQLISSFAWALVEVHLLLFCLNREMINYLCRQHIGPKAISPCKVQWGALWYLFNIHGPEYLIGHPVCFVKQIPLLSHERNGPSRETVVLTLTFFLFLVSLTSYSFKMKCHWTSSIIQSASWHSPDYLVKSSKWDGNGVGARHIGQGWFGQHFSLDK